MTAKAYRLEEHDELVLKIIHHCLTESESGTPPDVIENMLTLIALAQEKARQVVPV